MFNYAIKRKNRKNPDNFPHLCRVALISVGLFGRPFRFAFESLWPLLGIFWILRIFPDSILGTTSRFVELVFKIWSDFVRLLLGIRWNLLGPY